VSDTQGVAWPTELVVRRAAKVLAVDFDTGEHFEIPFELLRVESPSAQVQGHSAADKKLITGKSGVMIVDVQAVGRYAVRLLFDDGHDSGIFTWDWLHRLGRDQDVLMDTYRTAVQSGK
jgi:DUF971 family protein